jgi:hypothetical protein
MAQIFSPEFTLLLRCSRWPPSEPRTAAIARAAATDIDWQRLRRLAERHRVVGLANDGLSRIATSLPVEVVDEFRAMARAVAEHSLIMAAEAIRLSHLLHSVGVPVLFLKGAALSALAYGNVGVRQSDDIDLLVPPSGWTRAQSTLERAGYSRESPPSEVDASRLELLRTMRKNFSYVSLNTGLRVELHWSLFRNRHFMTAPTDWANPRMVALADGVSLPALADDILFAYLCAHGSLHWWHRIQWLADIGAIVAASSTERLDKLAAAAEASGVGRAAAFALLLCRELLSVDVPKHLTATLDRGRAADWMRKTAFGAMGGGEERERGTIALGTTRGSLSTLLLKDDWRYRVDELRALNTSQEDVLSVSLPRALWGIYPLLRFPLWLWRHAAKSRQERF